MKFLKSFLLSIAAGLSIGIGGLLNVVCTSKGLPILGNILFATGLFTICIFGFKLFTGQVGYLFAKDNKKEFLIQLVIFYLGNFIGAVGFGYLLRLTAVFSEDINNTITSIAHHKLVSLSSSTDVGQPFYSVIILAIFCGLLVFFAVDLFRNEKIHPVVRFFGLVLFIGGFVICGFEHCIADMFYFGFAGTFTSTNLVSTILSILCGSTGNIIGAFAGYFITKLAGTKA